MIDILSSATRRLVVALGAAVLPIVAVAQTSSEVAAHTAVTQSPIGALPPVLTATMIGHLQEGAQLAVRYGYQEHAIRQTGLISGGYARREINGNHFAATAVMPLGLGSTASITAGAWVGGCSDCDSHLMVSAAADRRIGSMALGAHPASPLFIVALNGELGVGFPDHGRTAAGSVGVPLSLVGRGQGMRIVPFVTPGVAFGSYYPDNGTTESATRPMVGAGVGLYNPASTLVVSFGATYVHAKGATAVYGVSLQFGGN